MSITTGAWPLPLNWSWISAGEIGEVGLGRQRSPKNHSGPSMRPYVRSANITWSGWNFDDVKEMNFDDKDYQTFQLRTGDVLLNEGSGSAGEVGKPAVWEGQIEGCCFQNTLLRFRSDFVDPWYAKAFFGFSARAGHLVKHTQGVNIFHIGKSGLDGLKIPTPPLTEQRRIVSKINILSSRSQQARCELAEADRLIIKLKKMVLQAALRGDLTKDFRRRRTLKSASEMASVQSEFEKAQRSTGSRLIDGDLPQIPATWAWMTVGSLSSKVVDGVHKKPDYQPSGVPFLTVKNLTAGPGIVFEDCKFVSEKDHAQFIKRTNPEFGDILISKDGTLGVTRAVRTRVPFSIFVSIALVKPIDRSMTSYLEYAFQSPLVQEQMTGVGTGLQHIHLTDLRKDLIPIAPIDERDEVVRRLNAAFGKIDKIALETQRAGEFLDILNQSILAKAFRGELVPQDPNDEPASVLLNRIRAERATAGPAPKRARRPRTAAGA